MTEAQVLQCLSALSNETRLAIVRLLQRRGAEGICAGGIGARLGASASRLSFHLKLLEQAGLVTQERSGRHVRYRLAEDRMRGVVGYMLADCCGDSDGARRCCKRDRPVTAERSELSTGG
ncbi:ArsR/SmtB family transcription factor [Pseudooceanicola aestuarii]|uniref:ArsR/SmtB family transcription factor n=1 Tax=Pseudooceanicola aestuarii TaxID=2697319 RepID=UPI0013D0FD7B|nr:metalloregulator ArsR/SmtB family transcription factor [Pseudooceanicola aestuarii]